MGNIESVYAVLCMGNEDPEYICIFKSNAERLSKKLCIDGYDSWVEEWGLWEAQQHGKT